VLRGFANYGRKLYVEGLRNASGVGRLDARGWTEVGETDSTPLFCYGLVLVTGAGAMSDGLESAIERLLDDMGFELVVLERGGGRRRPLLRLRVGRLTDPAGRSSLTAGDCSKISRAVMDMLEQRSDAEFDFLLEVSSPGVERPLVRVADYRRFAGEPVRVRGYGPIIGDRKQVDAVLLGLEPDESEVLLEVDGERVSVPVTDIARANLRFSFDGK